jgi:hypothetical protein
MEKVFCGSAKIITTKFGDLTKVSFSQKDIDTLQANMVNGWINLVIKEKKTKVDGKPTHYLEVDTFVPTKQDTAKAVETQNSVISNDFDPLPF